MHKIILVKRDASTYATWKNLERKKRINELSVEQIVNIYKGFEGEIIAVCEANERDEDLKKQVEEFPEKKNAGISFLLFIQSGSSSAPSYIELNGSKLGYDVGICAEEDDEVYSSIFHEILFGVVDELAVFKEKLNGHFLFDDELTALEYVEVHNEMSARGKDVEDFMPMNIYEIWNLN